MAAVASPSDTADLLENLSLDSQTKTANTTEPGKKLSSLQYGSSDLATNTAKPLNRSTTPVHLDPNAYYFPHGYPSTTYYYGGYDGYGSDWSDYSRFPNPEGIDVSHGFYGDSGTVMYQQGYGYAPFGTYPSPDTPVPPVANDGQLYGTQQYQYPSPFYQPPTSTSSPNQANLSQGAVQTSATVEKASLPIGTATGNPNYVVNTGSVNRNNEPKPFRPSNQNASSNLNGSYKRGGLPTRFPSSGYRGPRFGYDGFQSPLPWFDASTFSNGPSRNATGAGFSSHLSQNLYQTTASLGQASGFMNLMYPNNKIYGQYGSRPGTGFGSVGYNSWRNGRGWVVVDNKYKPRGRGYGNENMDGLSELNRGPRTKCLKNQKEFGPVSQTVEGQKLPLTENNKEDNLPQNSDKEQCNREDFPEDYSEAKFFIIKSYSEDDVHKSIKYGVWSSTPNGNKKLDAAYHEAKEKPGGCPVFLLFSVNTSGQFVGLAEMVGPVDFDKTVDYWQQEKWIGCFPVKWHIIKDVPNSSLRHITIENNENKPVTNSRDTQEVTLEKGIQILKIFKSHKSKTSILDDFGFYAVRERTMQERRAKQKIQKQTLDSKSGDVVADDKDKATTTVRESSQKPGDAALIKQPVGTAAV